MMLSMLMLIGGISCLVKMVCYIRFKSLNFKMYFIHFDLYFYKFLNAFHTLDWLLFVKYFYLQKSLF